jgi:hypothetical protein
VGLSLVWNAPEKPVHIASNYVFDPGRIHMRKTFSDSIDRRLFRRRAEPGTGNFFSHDAAGDSQIITLIVRPSSQPLEAPLTVRLKLSKAEADITCEHPRNRAGEAVLALGMTSGWASICFEMQVRITLVQDSF